MREYWTRIERRLTELGCLKEMGLLPGASENEIAALEAHVGIVLPDIVRKFLAVHNGQEGFGLVYGYGLLSVSGIREQWDLWRSIDEDEMNADFADSMRSEPEGVIKPMYCNRGWLPLTHDAGSNYMGLDFDPDSAGKVGQVIRFGRDEQTKHLVADTFENFLDKYIAWLRDAEWNGRYLEEKRSA